MIMVCLIELKKPEVILNCNKFMDKVDRTDQFLYWIYVLFFTQIIKMVVESFFLRIEVFSLNIYILYKTDCKHNNSKPWLR
ncbi:piggyBac transposable element-derived protein 4-like [Vespula maculifrons]|uniref:PiggyBac transposable element-derived protein 4-like n=1 Tax=Vespula maculifrons TaxID=7453 RepID=A0ABD2AGR3_VESMC